MEDEDFGRYYAPILEEIQKRSGSGNVPRNFSFRKFVED
jgi:hypothetical protein